MASKSKEDIPDKRMVAGGKIRVLSNALGSRRSSAAGLSSGGESSKSSSDEDFHGEYVEKNAVQRQEDSVEFCAALGRPDRVTSIRQIPNTSLEDVVVRSSDTADHVLLKGSPSMLFYPLRCPFKEERCESFRARAPQYMKEHLESRHKLLNVQVNLVCPCPALCNVVNGTALECHAIKYDQIGGGMQSHLKEHHPTYFKTMGESLCIRNDTEEDLRGVSEEVKNYAKNYLETGKKLPAWTMMDPRRSASFFPSQLLPEKVILQTVVKDKSIQYKCHIHPCRGGQVMVRFAMSMHLRHEPGHRERMGSQALIVERCPKCDLTMHWSGKKMLLHIRAMHPELLGKPSNPTEAAKVELAKLVSQIKGKVIGRAIGDTAKSEDDSDGTEAHFLYSFRCHLQDCKQVFSKSEHLEWHIMADHQQEWNKSGIVD